MLLKFAAVWFLTMTMLYLSGCASETPVAAHSCPAIRDWSADDAQADADLAWLKTSRPDSPLIGMIDEAAGLRQTARDCQNK